MLNKLLGIFLPLAIEKRIRNRSSRWVSFIFFYQDFPSESEGYV